MNWFPQQYAHEYFAVLALVAVALTVTLVRHMARAWDTFVTKGQRLRYLSLLYASVLAVVAGVEQFQNDNDVQFRNLGTAGFLTLGVYAMWVTFREWRDGRP